MTWDRALFKKSLISTGYPSSVHFIILYCLVVSGKVRVNFFIRYTCSENTPKHIYRSLCILLPGSSEISCQFLSLMSSKGYLTSVRRSGRREVWDAFLQLYRMFKASSQQKLLKFVVCRTYGITCIWSFPALSLSLLAISMASESSQ